MPKFEKGDNFSQTVTEFCQNQVIYTLDTICEPNIMILVQAVLEVFCSQGSIGLQWESRKKKAQTDHGQAQTNMPPQLLRSVFFFHCIKQYKKSNEKLYHMGIFLLVNLLG